MDLSKHCHTLDFSLLLSEKFPTDQSQYSTYMLANAQSDYQTPSTTWRLTQINPFTADPVKTLHFAILV